MESPEEPPSPEELPRRARRAVRLIYLGMAIFILLPFFSLAHWFHPLLAALIILTEVMLQGTQILRLAKFVKNWGGLENLGTIYLHSFVLNCGTTVLGLGCLRSIHS